MPTNSRPFLVGFLLISLLMIEFTHDSGLYGIVSKNYADNSINTLDDLRKYALIKINEDRKDFGLDPILLSNNHAAQIHANELLNTETISHLTTDGFKPFMLYTIYNGTGYVQQNVGEIKYVFPNNYYNTNQKSSDLCKNLKIIHCPVIDHFKAIHDLQYSMIYNDSSCCNNGHRNNILNEFHTHVSIGIAYNDYYFVLVQNFENHYLDPNLMYQKENNEIKLKAKILNPNEFNFSINHVSFFLDKYPTKLDYEKYRDKNSYDFGDLEVMISKPLPENSKYVEENDDYEIIEAKKWILDKNSFDLEFQLPDTLDVQKKVMTMVVYAEKMKNSDNDSYEKIFDTDYVPVASYTFFNS